MRKTILQILKYIGALAFGGIIGLIGVSIFMILFTDITFSELITKFANIDWADTAGYILISILSLLFSFTLHLLLHEGGHCVAGLLSGYRFVSFRIGNITLLRTNNKLRIKRFSLEGTAGQCLMMPPQKPIDDIPTVLYNLGGVLFNIIFSIIGIIIFILTTSASVASCSIIFAMIGILLALINGIPMKVGGVSNDGNNVLYLNKDTKAKEAFVYQLITNALVQDGTRPAELPDEYLSFDTDFDYKDPLAVNWLILSASVLIDRQEYDRAYTLLDHAMQHSKEIMQLFVYEIACELVFTALITGHIEQAKELYNKDLARYIEQHKNVMSAKQRISCAIALYIDKDAEKAQQIYREVCDRRDSYLMQGEVKMDLALMEKILTDKK
ncbi:MAG: hypothetical protein IJE18_09100 [Bacteroidaceae bacterium]|nr:hypothetical protein [Bacteroidaceae bacterium]